MKLLVSKIGLEPVDRSPRRVANERPVLVASVLYQKAAVLEDILSDWQAKQLDLFQLDRRVEEFGQSEILHYCISLY